MRRIESKDNPVYKKLAALRSASYAAKNKLVAVEGLRHVLDVLSSGYDPAYLYFSDDEKGKDALKAVLEMDRETVGEGDDRLIQLPAHLFHRATAQKASQGLIALFPYRMADLETFLSAVAEAGSACQLLILEAIQDPGNVGTLIRTADALGLDGVLLEASCASVWNAKTAAASMGSLFHLPVLAPSGSLGETLDRLKADGFELIGSGLKGQGLAEARLTGAKTALMLGNEGSGLSDEAALRADRILTIPMKGEADSLNVASAGAILLWELVKQRTAPDRGPYRPINKCR